MAEQTQTVWVWHLTHRHGDDVLVFASEELAYATLFNYVKEWWETECPADAEMPDDPKEAIEAYFELVEDEWSWVGAEPVLTDAVQYG